jgi:DNA polymerase elongation subunit (family B)
MSDFYLSAKVFGDSILYRGIRNGKKISTKIPYSPSIFVPTNQESQYKTIYGENLKKIKPGSIKETKEYVKKYESVENFKIYGNTKFEYCLISDLFPEKVDWNIDNIRIGIIDIEVNSDPEMGGFAKAHDPFQPITSIAYKIYSKNECYLFGLYDFDCPKGVKYYKCKDEYDLCARFLDVWSENYPDILSGWNVQTFDVPYLVNRFKRILGEKDTKRLSPWGILRDKVTRTFNKKLNRYIEEMTYTIYGISTLDYIILYKKYQKDGNSQESYKLDFIAENEIQEKKVEYEGSLHKLYTEDKQKFYEYNIQDVILIEKLNDKCRLFELGLTLAYDTKTNHEDIFMQTVMWDALTYDFLKKKNIQVPPNVIEEDEKYEGAYVKPPLTGFFKWISTLDATSLYPSIMMTKNISPETIIPAEKYTPEMRSILSQGVGVESLLNKKVNLENLKDLNITITPNNQFFTREFTGFVPEMIEKMFNERKEYKKNKLIAEKEYESICKILKETDDPELKEKSRILALEVVKYDNLQNAKKLCLNSCYGAFGSKYFRFFDIRIAEAITLDGQLANRWTERNINRYVNEITKKNVDTVLAMDTDSVLFTLQDIVEKVCPKDYSIEQKINFIVKLVEKKIQPEVDSFCAELMKYTNAYKPAISYKLEKICSAGIFVAKKRYALNVFYNEGVVYSSPKIKVTGLEVVKSSTPAIIRNTLKECIKLILDEKQDDLISFLEEFKKFFMTLTAEKIAFPRGVKGLDKYYSSSSIYAEKTPMHVRASLLFNYHLEQYKIDSIYEQIKDGDKIKYCYLRLPNPIKENVIAFPDKLPKEFELQNYVDYEKMWNKSFVEPLSSLTTLVGWDMEKRNSIDDFF